MTAFHNHHTSHPSYVASPSHRRRFATHHIPTLALVFTVLASIFTTITFIMDIVFEVKARDAANDTKGLITVQYGNAVWMTMVAMIFLWFANVEACANLVRERRRIARAGGGTY